MHQRFVMEQLRAVVIAERGTGAQADAMRAGRRLGEQIRIERDSDDAPLEKPVQIVLQLHAQGGGRDRHLLFRRHQFAIQLLRDLDEMLRRFACARPVARHRVLRHAEQLRRVFAHRRGAQRLQQTCCKTPAMRRIDEVFTQRMMRVGVLGDGGQFAPVSPKSSDGY